ncbi:MAG: hypothetical protein WCO81_09375 [Cyanobacteriota bacterium ELA615]
MVSIAGAENNRENLETPADEVVLKEVKGIYQAYCLLHNNSRTLRKPLGVVINLKNYRGQLIFTNTPVLLPEELFLTLKQIES